MPRTESYLLRLSKSEKDQLAEKARAEDISIAKLIRQRVGLDTEEEKPPHLYGPPTPTLDYPSLGHTGVVQNAGPIPPAIAFDLRVAKHKRFMSTRKAEAKAREELNAT